MAMQVLRLECKKCKYKSQLPIKRCKTFELGGKAGGDSYLPS